MADDRNNRYFEDRDNLVSDDHDGFIDSHGEALLDEHDQATLELRAEELQVHKREVEQGRVRIDKRIEHVPFSEDIDVEMDVVEVQRVPRFEDFDTPPESRYEGDTLIIPVVEEVLVVTRRYRVTEEVHVTTRRELRTERIEDELRREVLDVDVVDTDPDTGIRRRT